MIDSAHPIECLDCGYHGITTDDSAWVCPICSKIAEIDLKRCPFCGSLGKFLIRHYYGDLQEISPTPYFSVRCIRCHSRVGFDHESLDSAAEAWNTRYDGTMHSQVAESGADIVDNDLVRTGFSVKNNVIHEYWRHST